MQRFIIKFIIIIKPTKNPWDVGSGLTLLSSKQKPNAALHGNMHGISIFKQRHIKSVPALALIILTYLSHAYIM